MSISLRNQTVYVSQLTLQKLRDMLRKRNTFGDSMLIRDGALFWNGTAEDVELKRAKLLFATKGHIVNGGLQNLINWISPHTFNSNYMYSLARQWTTSKTYAYISLGIGGSITTGSTNALTSALGTVCDGQSGSMGYSGSQYKLSFHATWNAGTLAAVNITEAGLFFWGFKSGGVPYLYPFGTAVVRNDSPSYGSTQMFSRLSVADGDFGSFSVNTDVPLTVEWRLTFEFA